jgi:uncharacterized protein (TIGR04255 family)
MEVDQSVARTLSKNSIKKFILKIDLINNDKLDYLAFAEKMSKYFDRVEKRQVKGFTVHFTKGESEVLKQDAFDYIFLLDNNPVTLTVSETQQAFWLESNYYRDNTVYKSIVEDIINEFFNISSSIESKRIGLRFINEFSCESSKNIGRIFNKRISGIVRSMISENSLSRTIGIEEFNRDGIKMRMQYGVPNKFYPSRISVYDLVLDIDSYIESRNELSEWKEIIKALNHKAYEQFVKEINPHYLESLI